MASLYINNSIPLNVCKRKCIKKKKHPCRSQECFSERRREAYGTLEGFAQFPSKSIIDIPLLLVKNRVPQVHWTLQYPSHQG